MQTINCFKFLYLWNTLFSIAAAMELSEIRQPLTEMQIALKPNDDNPFVCMKRNILCIILTYLHGHDKEDMRKLIANIPSKKLLPNLLELYALSISEPYLENIFHPNCVLFIARSYVDFNKKFLDKVSLLHKEKKLEKFHYDVVMEYNQHIDKVIARASTVDCEEKRLYKVFFHFFGWGFYLVWPLIFWFNIKLELTKCNAKPPLFIIAIAYHMFGALAWFVKLIDYHYDFDVGLFFYETCPLLIAPMFSVFAYVSPFVSVGFTGIYMADLAECGEDGSQSLLASVGFPLLVGLLVSIFGIPIFWLTVNFIYSKLYKKEKYYFKNFKKIAI